ncbi:hypothetical protein A5784_11120 [Mycobacterium sp. 852013-50091_SCH5140682]|nr:hypothetical protein A5784_11120 [Mycobacterium sp. 852013-50091_SCH5140682]
MSAPTVMIAHALDFGTIQPQEAGPTDTSATALSERVMTVLDAGLRPRHGQRRGTIITGTGA